MRYQSRDVQLAPAVGPFGQSVRAAVDVARRAKDLSDVERRCLDELSRKEERYHHKMLERLCAILSRVDDAILRESFPEAVLSAIACHRGGREAPSLRDALLAETGAVADADHVQHEAALNPDAPISVIDRAIATTQRQIAASRLFLGSLARVRFQRLHGGRA